MPAGIRVYAIGDVHGRVDLLDALHRRIDDDRSTRPEAREIEVMLGDYIDRGSASAGVIDRIQRRREKREIVTLVGNHELMMLGALSRPETFPDWLANGGMETLISYGIPVGRPSAAMPSWAELAGAVLARVPDEHLQLFRHLVPSFACGDYFFVHAGVRPGRALDRQRTDDLVWIRKPFLTSTADFGAVVVHGHTPVTRPDVRPNRINIDTGAYATNRLTCLVLEDDSLAFLQT